MDTITITFDFHHAGLQESPHLVFRDWNTPTPSVPPSAKQPHSIENEAGIVASEEIPPHRQENSRISNEKDIRPDCPGPVFGHRPEVWERTDYSSA